TARSRAEKLLTKETFLVERERAHASKEREVEAQSKAVTDRLVALEKDAARRDVLRFLGTVPGMSEAQADVIASAFPDMASLESADAKALTQCQGVTDALARAIRYELVPGEVDEEQVATRLQEEALAFLGEGDYEAALDCYDRLLRARRRPPGPRRFGHRGSPIHAGPRQEPAERDDRLPQRGTPRTKGPMGRCDPILQSGDRPEVEFRESLAREGEDPAGPRSSERG